MKQMKKLLAWILLFAMVLTCIPSMGVEAKEDIVINAVDYGADPTGEKDSTQAIWDALNAAKEAEKGGNSVTLEFPKGEYHVYQDHAQVREYHTSNTNSIENPNKRIGILVEGHENLTIEGNDSLFMMHGKMIALAVVNSQNITLKNFAWDFAVPTVVEMTVTEVGSDYTEYYIADCFPHTVSGTTIHWSSDVSPYTGQAYWSGSGHQPDGRGTYAVVGYHPEDEMARNYYPSDGPLSNVSRIEEIDENTVKVYYSSRTGEQSSNQRVGTVFELCGNAHREMAGAFTWESENVTADGVDVHFMHGFGWLIQMSKDVYYKNCNLVPRENSGHTTVSFADGIHASGAAGELVFENCNFANTHDDPLNLHGTFTRVESRNNANTLTLKYIHAQQGGFPQYHVGDKVQFFTRDTLESTDHEAMYTVAEIVQNTDESSDKKTMIIRFEETLPENLSDTVSGQPKYVAENVTYAPAVTVKNCTFKNVPTRGLLCTTRNKVLIEGNVFYNMSMATIYLSNDSDEWYESGPIRDMMIKNNVFYIKDIGRTAWNTAPAIYVHPVTKGGGLPDASNPIHKNITIEGNTFFMDLDRVVEAESVENLTFRNNKVYRMNPEVEIEIDLDDTTLAAGETKAFTVNTTGNTNNGSIDNLFQFKACKNVVIEGNTYDDGLKLCAVVDQATKNNGITVNDEEIAVVTSASTVSEPVADVQYATTDPEVVKVDAEGNLTGVSEGTATVFVYYQWNGTIIRSNYVEITVAGEFDGEESDSEDQKPEVTYELNPNFTIVRGNDNHSYDAASIKIISENKSDLYQGDNTLKNLFLYTPDVDRSNLRTSVKVEGLPIKENNKWDTASFILFAGDDDYYTIGKKSHYNGFATVKERAQAATETGESTDANNAVSTAWLGMTKVGDKITLDYSLDGTTWNKVGEFTDSTFGNDYQIGFGSWTSTNTGRVATFSEFKVGTADQSYGELEPVEILTVVSENDPEVSNTFVAFGTEVVFEEGDAEEVTVRIPEEVQKIEMTYAFEDDPSEDVEVLKNGIELEGSYENSGSVILEVADGDVIVINRGGVEYTFTIEMMASNVTRIRRIFLDTLNFNKLPAKSDTAYYLNAGEDQGTGTIEIVVDKAVGSVEILQGELREALEITKSGNTYSADYVLEEGLNSFYVKSKAADGISEKQYIINVTYSPEGETVTEDSETVTDASDASKDYTGEIDYTAGSVENREGNEGPIALAFDGNPGTYWHSEWSPSWNSSQLENYLWVEINLEEATMVDAIRYLPRPGGGNGDITGYRVEGTTDGTTWKTLTTGTWTRTGQEWKVAEFTPTEVAGLRLVATSTYADSGNNKFASAAELRVRTYVAPADKTALEEAIAAAEALIEANYTEDSWNVLVEALEEAEIININKAATQEEVAKAIDALNDAVKNLQLVSKDLVTDVFSDVKPASWYVKYIQYVYDKQIMTGITGTTRFAPNEKMTRAMVIETLYKLAGKPTNYAAVDPEKMINDYDETKWWAPALKWALSVGVANGDSDTKLFYATKDVSRQELATFLYRYETRCLGNDVNVDKEMKELIKDAGVSAWAQDAFAWAVENEIIKGKEQTNQAGEVSMNFDPAGNSTRAEMATMLTRFINGEDLP